MTRKDELRERALRFMADEHSEPSDLVELLEQVEREVWEKVICKCFSMTAARLQYYDALSLPMQEMAKIRNEELQGLAEWLKAQQQEIG